MDDGQEDYDIDLLIAVRAGDSAAFSRLYRRHSVVILRFAWTKLGERAAAEDLTQETFAVVWSKRMTALVVGDSLLPWILTIARNLLRNELRKSSRRRALQAELPSNRATPTFVQEDLAWMNREFDKLSDVDQALCRLCLVEGFTFREAAELVDSSEAAVSKRVQRARTRLRVALGHDE